MWNKVSCLRKQHDDRDINDVLGIINDILQPGQSYSKMCGTEPRYNEPRYNEILVIYEEHNPEAQK